jgi:hypothetical protein
MTMLARFLLPRYAAGALPRPLARHVRRALDRDAALAAAYDALRRAERHAAGGAALSSGQLDVILDRVLGSVVDSVLEDVDDAAAAQHASSSASASSSSSWFPALGAAACAAAVLVVARPAVPGPDPGPAGAGVVGEAVAVGTLQGRGAASTTGHHEPLGVRIRCLDETRVRDEATAGARQRGADLECDASALLAFSTTNLAAQPRYAFVVGLDEDGGRVWLGPFARDAAATPIPAGAVDVVLPELAPMASLPGQVTLHVLLGDAPFTGADVERRLAVAERSAVPLGRLDRLPVDVAVQSHLTLYRVP